MDIAPESHQTRRARKKLAKRLEARFEVKEGDLEEQKEKIQRWLTRHESDRVTLEDTDPIKEFEKTI